MILKFWIALFVHLNLQDSGKTKNIFKENKVSETLDSLMTITCKHLEQSFNDGRFAKVCLPNIYLVFLFLIVNAF